MYKLYSTSKIWIIFLICFAVASCAPKYGQHFAPSSHSSSAKAPEKYQSASSSMLPQMVAPAETALASVKNFDPAPQPLVANSWLANEASAKGQPEMTTRRQQKEVIRELRSQLKSMNGAERAALQHQLQEGLEAYKASPPPPSSGASNIEPVLLVIITVLLPPLGVFLYEGEITNRFWISLLLTLLFYLPGLIYSLLVIFDQI